MGVGKGSVRLNNTCESDLNWRLSKASKRVSLLFFQLFLNKSYSATVWCSSATGQRELPAAGSHFGTSAK